ncbi:hypothetical protein [Marinicella rhabdoformis]|uniref:hypothetical protein n=1 Tax=Marinicella rhabdoformis TaxID=2580566 RepID=UPI0015D079EF|nr:hypothetical protein [Marinicella rhabdoformis]
MDTLNTYADFLTYFMSLIVLGIAIKYRYISPSKKEPITLMGKQFGRNQVTGFATIVFMGVVIQLVSNTVGAMRDGSILQEPVMMGSFAASFALLVTAKK